MYIPVTGTSATSQRFPLADGVEGSPPPMPSPPAAFAAITGGRLLFPVLAMLAYRFSTRRPWGRAVEVGLITAGVLYLISGVAAGSATALALRQGDGAQA